MASQRPEESRHDDFESGSARSEQIYREFFEKGLQRNDVPKSGMEDMLNPDTVADKQGVDDYEDTDISSVRMLTGIMLEVIGAPENDPSEEVNLGELDYDLVGDTVRCDAPPNDDVVSGAVPVFTKPADMRVVESMVPVFDLDSDRFDDD